MIDLPALLDGYRENGPNRGIALCPAHDDTSPSLSVRLADGDNWLINCFAGCGAADVLAALNLEFSDLYPEQLEHHQAPRKPNHWHAAREALRAIKHEALIVAIAAIDVADGKEVTADNVDRLLLAEQRIRNAVGACE